ncbi:MAG TPA: hypothetical protein PKE30_06390 [Niabella sp.]|nr:hypothetical protein [Niabella sp.]
MKKFFIITCTLLLFAISVKATPANLPKENNYWVTETGPRSNPYTIIRLYDTADNQFLEILMNGYRLKTNKPAVIRRLNHLANAVDVDDAINIAALLRIEICRVSSVKKINETPIV